MSSIAATLSASVRGLFGRRASEPLARPATPRPVLVTEDVFEGKGATATRRAVSELLGDGQLASLTATKRPVIDGTRYTEVRGRPVVLRQGTVVEGSTEHGGMQPHYVIDTRHPDFAEVLAQAREIRAKGLTPFAAAREVMAMVRKTLTHRAYRSRPYLALLNEHRDAGRNISLGEYVAQKCGVCREHGMVTHLALQEAGLQSAYLYVKARQASRGEDHGFAIFRHENTWWVADAYNDNYNGFRLKDVLRTGGTRERDDRAPFAKPAMFGCSANILPYPRYWLPTGPA